MPKDSIEYIKINLDFIGNCECPETRAGALDSAKSHLNVLEAQINRLQNENKNLLETLHKIIEVVNADALN